MRSRTDIVNSALRSIAANLIADYDEDTEGARQARGVYDQVVRAELENHPWGFAKKQASLAAAADPPLFRYANAFTLPSDFVRLVDLNDRTGFPVVRGVDTNPTPLYEVQGGAILTDLPAPLNITYIYDVSGDPSNWPPLFCEVVASALSVSLAMTLSKSEGMVSLMEKLYQKALRRAAKANAVQKSPVYLRDGSWITARMY